MWAASSAFRCPAWAPPTTVFSGSKPCPGSPSRPCRWRWQAAWTPAGAPPMPRPSCRWRRSSSACWPCWAWRRRRATITPCPCCRHWPCWPCRQPHRCRPGWAGACTALLALAVWLLWCKLHFPAAPLPWLVPGQVLPHDFSDPISPARLGVALLLSLYAAGAAVRLRLAASRWIISWTAGLALAWGLLSLLLLPWIDAAKSYRALLGEAMQALPAQQRCLASIGLGESERAMLHYYFAVVSVQVDTPAAAGCDALLVEQTRQQQVTPDAATWTMRWQGSRPGDTNERFRLYLREGAAGAPQP